MEAMVSIMDKPYKYHVTYRNSKGVLIERLTNDNGLALKWGCLYDGVIYEDIRYYVRLRLYNYINRIG